MSGFGREHSGEDPVAASGSDVKCFGFDAGEQVARLERVLRGEACGGRCCQDVQQVQRLMESRDGCHVSPVLLDGVKWSGRFGDTGAQMLCDLSEAHCALTRLPVWNGVNPVAR